MDPSRAGGCRTCHLASVIIRLTSVNLDCCYAQIAARQASTLSNLFKQRREVEGNRSDDLYKLSGLID